MAETFSKAQGALHLYDWLQRMLSVKELTSLANLIGDCDRFDRRSGNTAKMDAMIDQRLRHRQWKKGVGGSTRSVYYLAMGRTWALFY